MPNTSSAEKRVRQNETRRAKNRQKRAALRTQVKKARQSVSGKDGSGTKEVLLETQKALDIASGQGLLHKNKAARLKSRLAAAEKRKK